jgi:DNA-binding FadR family transcriptional regulator
LKTSESVARDIVDFIVASGLGEGDVLPSEAKMVEQYAVSRESLREGLRLLEAQGLITIRRGPGGGPVVGTVDPSNLGRVSTLFYHLVGATYRELVDAWGVAEGYLAERAARNPDRALVRATLEPFLVDEGADGQVLDGSVEGFVDHHVHFHALLGTLAGNRVMQLSLMAIGQIVTHHVVFTFDPRDVGELIHADHRDIAEAVIAARPMKARDLMREHLVKVAEAYERSAGASMLDQLIEWRPADEVGLRRRAAGPELLGPADLHVLVGDDPPAVDLAHRVVVPGDDLAAPVGCIRCRLVRRVVREGRRLGVADEVDVVHVQHVVLPRGRPGHVVDPLQEVVRTVDDGVLAVLAADVLGERGAQGDVVLGVDRRGVAQQQVDDLLAVDQSLDVGHLTLPTGPSTGSRSRAPRHSRRPGWARCPACRSAPA